MRQVILVSSPAAGRGNRLDDARRAMVRVGLEVQSELPVTELPLLDEMMRGGNGIDRLVVAAGGDGTVGAVAGVLAHGRAVLGVIPLGTSNDFARSLGISMRIDRAVRLLVEGKVSTVDMGRLEVPDRPPAHFVHAATAGLNVSFARLATRASLRHRLGRLTYVVAALAAFRDHRPFACRLLYAGRNETLHLTHLSVINAPVFGGFLGMRLRDSSPDDRLLDVLAVEELGPWRAVAAGIHQLLGIRRPLKGVHAFHVPRLHVHTDEVLEVALDGEIAGRLPAEFAVAAEALRVITPLDFEDVDALSSKE